MLHSVFITFTSLGPNDFQKRGNGRKVYVAVGFSNRGGEVRWSCSGQEHEEQNSSLEATMDTTLQAPPSESSFQHLDLAS